MARVDPVRAANTREWLLRAEEDLAAAERVFGGSSPLVWIALFPSHQAVEKAFQALLTWKDVPFRRIHILEALGEACVGADARLAPVVVTRAAPLSVHAGRFRYPGAPYEPTDLNPFPLGAGHPPCCPGSARHPCVRPPARSHLFNQLRVGYGVPIGVAAGPVLARLAGEPRSRSGHATSIPLSPPSPSARTSLPSNVRPGTQICKSSSSAPRQATPQDAQLGCTERSEGSRPNDGRSRLDKQARRPSTTRRLENHRSWKRGQDDHRSGHAQPQRRQGGCRIHHVHPGGTWPASVSTQSISSVTCSNSSLASSLLH